MKVLTAIRFKINKNDTCIPINIIFISWSLRSLTWIDHRDRRWNESRPRLPSSQGSR
jgi:hypothetical protein